MRTHANTLLIITGFLGLWCLLWAFEDLIALNIYNYSYSLNSNCYVIVIEKMSGIRYELLRKKALEQNVKVNLLNPGQIITVSTLYILKILQKNSIRNIFKFAVTYIHNRILNAPSQKNYHLAPTCGRNLKYVIKFKSVQAKAHVTPHFQQNCILKGHFKILISTF